MNKHPPLIPLPLPSSCYPSFRAEVKVDDKIAVIAIGQLNPQGVFWVRMLPDPSNLQEIMLQNISTAIGWVSYGICYQSCYSEV